MDHDRSIIVEKFCASRHEPPTFKRILFRTNYYTKYNGSEIPRAILESIYRIRKSITYVTYTVEEE